MEILRQRAAVKNYEELSFCDDFMFGKTMEDLELCREVIECLQQSPVGELTNIETEKEYRFTADGKPIRLDVCTRDEFSIYDAEMQNLNHKSVGFLMLPKRSRYYQSAIDTDLMNKGASYKDLPASKVMFICTFDPFGLGLSRYTFRETCEEEPNLRLCDGTEKIFYNCTYTGDDIPEDLRHLYEYIRTGQAGDALTKRIDAAVNQNRRNEIWRSTYMKERIIYMDAKDEGREEGRDEGRSEGLRSGMKLIQQLIKVGRSDEIERVTEDAEYRQKVMEELQIYG